MAFCSYRQANHNGELDGMRTANIAQTRPPPMRKGTAIPNTTARIAIGGKKIQSRFTPPMVESDAIGHVYTQRCP